MYFAGVNQEGIHRCDLEGEGGTSGHVGKINVVGNTYGPKIVQVTRPLCRVWNTTALIYARLWDTENGREEEEEREGKIDRMFYQFLKK